MKPPLFLLPAAFLLLQLVASASTVTAAAAAAASCENIVCPAVVIPLPKECSIRTTPQIPAEVCTCVWDPCSCGYSCRFPSCPRVNTTVTCPGEPCASKECTYGCTNDYCNGCAGHCWEKPYNPTNSGTTPPGPSDTPANTASPPTCGVCPAVVVPLPDGCRERNDKSNSTSACLCDWDQCSCKWRCSIPSIPTCPNPVQCLIDPCSTTTCVEGSRCMSSYCGACTATCIPIEAGPNPPDCPNPVQCAVDPCASMSCVTGTVCERNYCYGCNATCKPITTEKPPINCDGVKCVDPCVRMSCVTGTTCVKTDCCEATCAPNAAPTTANDTSTCSHHGQTYPVGQTINDGCNTCVCQRMNGSLSMVCTEKACSSSTSGITNGTCIYDGQTYTVGQSVRATDGCNMCSCMQGGMACTLMACISSSGTINNNTNTNNNNVTCTAGGRTYTPGQRTISLDGCNSCSCGQDGQIACTLMACLNNTATITSIDVTPMVLVATTVVLAMIG